MTGLERLGLWQAGSAHHVIAIDRGGGFAAEMSKGAKRKTNTKQEVDGAARKYKKRNQKGREREAEKNKKKKVHSWTSRARETLLQPGARPR